MSRRLMSGNKGFFFSIIAVMLLVLLAVQLSGRQRLVVQGESEALQTQFEVAHNFLTTLEAAILPRLLEADVAVALDSIARDINDTKSTISDHDTLLAMVESIVVGDQNALVEVIMDEFVETQAEAEVHAAKIREYTREANISKQVLELSELAVQQLRIVDVDIGNINISFWQDNETGPRYVRAAMNFSLALDAGFATWNRPLANATTLIGITRQLDPYMMSQLPAGKPFDAEITMMDVPVNISTIEDFIYNRTYAYDNNSPSYLQRFTGDLSPSGCCGLESAIGLDTNVPMSAGELVREPMIDWCYFTGGCNAVTQRDALWVLIDPAAVDDPLVPTITSTVAGTPVFAFALGSYHLEKYNLSGYYLTSSNECACNLAIPGPTATPPGPGPQYEGPGCIGNALSEAC